MPFMHSKDSLGLRDVQAVYSGPEGQLWEMVMGEQIHIGGLVSSLDLAEKANIEPGTRGVDLCCCTGAGMRFLARFRGVQKMQGVDATEKVVAIGRHRSEREGFGDRIQFTLADVCDTGLPGGQYDFAWGEDAWCYVADKDRLLAEASRLVRPEGIIAFTDWVEGPAGLTDEEAERLLTFMKFPSLLSIKEYELLLEKHSFTIDYAINTGRFEPYMDLYLEMLTKQLTYDALKFVGFDMQVMDFLKREMLFMQELAHAGKIAQGLFVARER
jgi:ubiquinone/menaquinone biosynthesis C-methylase UbiE